MAIQPLPLSTTRILKSSQVLTTPVSLVKELIDNAIDARASAIEIIISSNTLDRIEVHDNGHGIAADDLNALGRHGHTSKLRSFKDLKTVGGTSLGFRGEALASAVELGDVTIITRTEGEASAVIIKLITPGRIESQNTASHPVGTTVSVANFLSRWPVRRQTAQNESKKTLGKIKDMLQSYALARLTVRLSLKVLKASKSNWSFVSPPNNTVHEVVSQVIGREIASQCMEKISVWTPDGCENIETVTDSITASILRSSQSFVFHAFLPRPDADFSKIAGRHYVSVDMRPVSCARGTLKRLVSIYRTHLRALAASDVEEKLKNVFIRVNIVCPPGSYDPNVEPAKDDVIFEFEDTLLTSAKQWFKDVYGDPNLGIVRDREPVSLDEEFQSRAAKKNAEKTERNRIAINSSHKEVPTRIFTSHKVFGHLAPPNTRFQALHTRLRRPSKEHQAIEQGSIEAWLNRSPNCHSASSDKISVAKSSTLFKIWGTDPPLGLITSKVVQSRGDFVSDSNLPHMHVLNDRPITEALNHWRLVDGTLPLQNKPKWGFNISRGFKKVLDASKSSGSISESNMAGYLDVQGDCNEDRTSTTLNPWIIAKFHTQIKSSLSDPGPAVQQSILDDNFNRTPGAECQEQDNVFNSDFNPSRLMRLQKAVSCNNTQIPDDFTEGRKVNIPVNRSFKTPQSFRAQNLVASNDKFVPALESNPRVLIDNTDVDNGLEVDRPKKTPTQKLGEYIPSHTVTYHDYPGKALPSTSLIGRSPQRDITSILPFRISSHPVTNISCVEEDKRPALTTLPDGDPRAYLMKRQKSLAVSIKSGARQNLERAKTMLLPLEVVPEVDRLGRLVRVLSIDADAVRKAFTVLGGEDCWAICGSQYMGLDIPTPDLLIVEQNIQEVLKRLEMVVDGVK